MVAIRPWDGLVALYTVVATRAAAVSSRAKQRTNLGSGATTTEQFRGHRAPGIALTRRDSRSFCFLQPHGSSEAGARMRRGAFGTFTSKRKWAK